MAMTPETLRKKFFSVLDSVAENPDRSLLAENSFTRHRTISLGSTLRFIVSMASDSIRQQTETFFKTHHVQATPSVFCQVMGKVSSELLENAAAEFTHEIVLDTTENKDKLRFIGLDGSNISVLPNLDEPENILKSRNDNFNVAYDLKQRLYLDYVVQPGAEKAVECLSAVRKPIQDVFLNCTRVLRKDP